MAETLESTSPPERRGAALLGVILIVVGIVAWALQRVDVTSWLGGHGWTLFIIGPGVLLLVAAIAARGDAAQGLTIGGAIVTTIGLLLLYQARTGHWESWAYAWALIPAAAGLALVVHGLRSATRELVANGLTMIAVAGGLLVAGAWYFETVFETGRVPFDLGASWPLALVVAGAVIVVLGLLRDGRHTASEA
jgi:hypothetical protein